MEKTIGTLSNEKAQLLYEGIFHFTQVKEYGIHYADLLSGKVPMPPAGARFDVEFEGSVQGDRLIGKVSGTDYLYIRADGRVQLHIHACFTTADEACIALFAEAAGTRHDETQKLYVRENVVMYSAFANYTWVNSLAVWSEVVINPFAKEISVKAYVL